MPWWLRALLGLWLGSWVRMPLLGAMIGLWGFASSSSLWRERAWIEACFMMLGACAGVKHVVRSSDIAFAHRCMRRWSYSKQEQHVAKQAFRKGRQSTPEQMWAQLQAQGFWRHPLMPMRLFEVLFEYARYDGNRELFERLRYLSQGHRFDQSERMQTSSGSADLQKAYELLGVSVQEDAAAVKRAFRKQISLYHPDRHANNAQANERTQQIMQAYALIKRHRGWD